MTPILNTICEAEEAFCMVFVKYFKDGPVWHYLCIQETCSQYMASQSYVDFVQLGSFCQHCDSTTQVTYRKQADCIDPTYCKYLNTTTMLMYNVCETLDDVVHCPYYMERGYYSYNLNTYIS